jgi:hypothetical protein
MTIRTTVRWTATLVILFAALHWTAGPAAAECPLIPPFPRAEPAIQSAKEVIVGKLVPASAADLGVGPAQEREMALSVIEVLRGPKRVGALVDVQFLQPNWPWLGIRGEDGRAFPSCTYLRMKATIGDTIVLALGAVQPRQRLEAEGASWIQPRTTYNAMTKIRTAAQLAEIRRIARLPETDTGSGISASATKSSGHPWAVVLAAGLIGAAVAWRRSRRRPAGAVTGYWPR